MSWSSVSLRKEAPISGFNTDIIYLVNDVVLNIVDVVSEFNMIANNTQSTEIFEQLFNSLIVNPAPNAASSSSNTGIKDENSNTNTKEQTNEQSKTNMLEVWYTLSERRGIENIKILTYI